MIWVYEELLGLILELIGAILTAVSDSVLSAFSLDASMFNAYIPFFANAEALIKDFGMALCTFIALIALIKNQLVLIFDEYEEPIPLALKYMFALVFCTFSKQIIDIEFQFFTGFYEGLMDLETFRDWSTTFVNSFGVGEAVGKAGTVTALLAGAFATGAWAHLAIAGLLLAVFIIMSLTVEFFKLLLEMAERYIVIHLGIVFSPLCACTVITKNSQKIFWAYLKTIFSQLLLMCMNVIFVKGALQCMLTAAQPEFLNAQGKKAGGIIVWFIFTMAFMRAGTAIDSYMRSLGLDVVQTGGSLLDAITGAAQSMFYMGRTIGGIKGGMQALVGSAGRAFSNMGTRTGIDAFSNIGSKLQGQAPSMPSGVASAIKNLEKGAMDASLFDGKKISSGIAQGLSQSLPKGAVNAAFGSLAKEIGNMDGASFTAQDKKLFGDLGDGRSFELSKEETPGATSITDAAGNEWWLSSTGSVPLSSNIGEVGSTQSIADMCGVDADMVASGIANGAYDAEDIMATNEGNGYFPLTNSDGDDLGSLNPDGNGYNFISAPEFSAYNEAVKRGVGANTQVRALLGEGYSDFSSRVLDMGGENLMVQSCEVNNGVSTIKTSDQSIYKILPSSQYTGKGGHEIPYGGSKGILVECNASGAIPKSVHRRNISSDKHNYSNQ